MEQSCADRRRLFCQLNICEQVCEAEGDYLILVKANQGNLFNDIRLLFEDPDSAFTLTDRREATTVDSGSGTEQLQSLLP